MVEQRALGEAFSSANAAMDRILESLRSNGVEDVQSSELEVHPDHDHQGEPRGFRAGVSARVTLRDVTAAGRVLAAAVEAGGDASRVHGLQLSSSSTQTALTVARDAAWADARAKAEQYALLADTRLGPVLSISESARDNGARPMHDLAMSAGPHLEGGSQSVRSAVTVRWSIAAG